MSDIQKEIKEALEKATPGPWMRKDNEVWTVKTDKDDYHTLIAKKTKCIGYEHDVDLIANAPTWLLHQQELIEQLQRKLDEGVELVEEGMVLVELFGKKLEKQEAEIERLTEQLEYSKLTPMQKMSRAMEIIDKQKGANTCAP